MPVLIKFNSVFSLCSLLSVMTTQVAYSDDLPGNTKEMPPYCNFRIIIIKMMSAAILPQFD